MLAERVNTTLDRMKESERQRFGAEQPEGFSLCSCGHVVRDAVIDYHKAVSFLHRDEQTGSQS